MVGNSDLSGMTQFSNPSNSQDIVHAIHFFSSLSNSVSTIDDSASNSSSTLPSHCSASQSSTSQPFFSSSAPLSGEALQLVISECKLKAKKKIERGVAFPTCISVNNTVCHFSQLASDETVLEEGDILKM
ncbi:hypothetical protein ACE6H2_020636 [Prunus campanulata]